MSYDTYCGLYCGACEVMKANERGQVEEKAKEWEEEPNHLLCGGCKSQLLSIYCEKCPIRVCAQGKGMDFCFQCTCYPCDALKDLQGDPYPHHSIIFHNLSFIQEKGLDKWLEYEAKRWSCSECGEEYTWYDETCLGCGHLVLNCKIQEERLTK